MKNTKRGLVAVLLIATVMVASAPKAQAQDFSTISGSYEAAKEAAKEAAAKVAAAAEAVANAISTWWKAQP